SHPHSGWFFASETPPPQLTKVIKLKSGACFSMPRIYYTAQKNYSMRKIANKFGVNIATISRKFIRCEKDNYILF
ncbi:hypothetical protein, partial [Gemella morbillorum]|uniref:hypothetical protein n=1 Tax=Gemella morbillorum TaxID=29391 RepID=UPI00319EA77F